MNLFSTESNPEAYQTTTNADGEALLATGAGGVFRGGDRSNPWPLVVLAGLILGTVSFAAWAVTKK